MTLDVALARWASIRADRFRYAGRVGRFALFEKREFRRGPCPYPRR